MTHQIDLICLDVLRSWQAYFKARFPEMTMACFSCYPKDRFVFQEGSTAASNQWLQKRSKRSFKRYFQSVGVRDILEACKSTQLLRNDELVDWDTLLAETLERLKEEQERAAVKEARSRDNDGKSLGRSRRRQRDLEEVEESESGNISASQLDSSDEEEDSDAEADLPVEMLSLDPEILEPSRDWITIGTVGHPWVFIFQDALYTRLTNIVQKCREIVSDQRDHGQESRLGFKDSRPYKTLSNDSLVR